MVAGGETEMGGDRRAFHPTAWTEVIRARDGSESARRSALEGLIRLYWKPVYFHVRRKGNDVERAKDLTQQFFADLLEREALRTVDPGKGKFRSFLLACLEHFLCDEHDRSMARKRRPDFDFARAETQYAAGHSFERDWAMTVLERAFVRLAERSPREAEVVAAQRTGRARHAELARRLGTTEGNVRVLAHRGRRRLREILLEELRRTVANPGDEKEELDSLFRAISL